MDFKDPQNKKQLQKNITALMKEYSDKLIAMSESNDYKKSALLYYWLQDYKNMLNRENNFSPKFMKKYSCGDIINVNFGFRPGAEEGGLHYAVVLDNNPRSSGVVTVIPLRSKKNKDAILRPFEVDLGEVLSTRIAAKTSTLIKEYKINYAVINGPEGFDLAKNLGGIKSIPTMYLINKESTIFQKYVGIVPNEMMEIDIKKVLEK